MNLSFPLKDKKNTQENSRRGINWRKRTAACRGLEIRTKKRGTQQREKKKVAPTPYDAHRRPPNWAEFIPSEREIELERKREETCRVDAA